MSLVNWRAWGAVRRSRKAALTISSRSPLDNDRARGAGAPRACRRCPNALSAIPTATPPATATGTIPANAVTAGVVIESSFSLLESPQTRRPWTLLLPVPERRRQAIVYPTSSCSSFPLSISSTRQNTRAITAKTATTIPAAIRKSIYTPTSSFVRCGDLSALGASLNPS